MNESWIGKDEAAIRNDIIEIAKEETGLTNFKRTGVLRGFLEVVARVVAFIYRTAVNSIYDQATLDGAAGFFLDLWGLLLGVVRKDKSKTEGAFTAAAFGSEKIPAGSWIVAEGTELRYRVKEDVPFEAGTFTVPVAAEFPGSAYNIGAGMPLRLTRIVPGYKGVSAGENWITAPGQDREEDDPYRARIQDRWRSQNLGDTKETYKYYAESVGGVRSARIIRTPRGPGSTDVVISAVNGLPGPELIEAVRGALYDHELMGFDVQVKAPSVLAVTVSIEYSGDADEADVRLVAERYVSDLGIGGRFAKSGLYSLYEALALKTVEIILPARDVQANENSIITAAITVIRTAA
jgi:uncharacterized phage protein gp47/JayE